MYHNIQPQHTSVMDIVVRQPWGHKTEGQLYGCEAASLGCGGHDICPRKVGEQYEQLGMHMKCVWSMDPEGSEANGGTVGAHETSGRAEGHMVANLKYWHKVKLYEKTLKA